MKHFNIVRPSITYDTQHTVTLSVTDWQSIKTDLFFAAYDAQKRECPATAARIEALMERLGLQIDDALDAASAHADSMEAAE